MYSVDIYNRVRRACLKDGMSARAAALYFNKDRKTIAKMLRHELPSGYRRSEPPDRPTLDAYVGIIDEILRTDKALIKKQRHTAKRIFERLRDEHGYAGSLTTVTYYVRERKQRTKEVLVPLSHYPGHAQVDFGETLGVIGGVECKIHFFVMSLPHSDAVFVKGYPAETTEAFCDGHVSAFAFFGGVYYPAGDCVAICREGPNPFSTTIPRSLWRGYSEIKPACGHAGLLNFNRITCLMTSSVDPRGGTTKATLRAWSATRAVTSWCLRRVMTALMI
jgi:hypothetical protein